MGPLSGIKVVELAGLGPCPMCAMLLAELGATVIRIDRKEPVELGIKRPLRYDLLRRSRKAIALDLKKPDAVEVVLRLVESADALIEGFRPGVLERLGLGPETCWSRNPRLVYGRVTGWGQSGPLRDAAGHDLNYIAVTGVLNAIGRRGQPPSLPLNLIGDFGGGALYLALGVLAGILEARQSGKGQTVDAAMVDGAASLATMFFGLNAAGLLNAGRGSNAIDSGAHFCNVYQCADHLWVAVSPTEGRFHAELLRRLEIDPAAVGDQMDCGNWDRAYAVLAEKFKTRTRDEWCSLLEGTDACFAPVLSWSEAPRHHHLRARETFVEVDGVTQPAPAPRFSRTRLEPPTPPQEINRENTDAALAQWLDHAEIAALREAGTIS
ncbi:MAG: CoA transferase [Betaproteobacteria bacterium]|nr:CoA transferase [Betaproteobacteria bacterium]